MAGPPEHERAITFRCEDEIKKRANIGAARRDLNLSEYLRTLVREDTEDIPQHVITDSELEPTS